MGRIAPLNPNKLLMEPGELPWFQPCFAKTDEDAFKAPKCEVWVYILFQEKDDMFI